MAFDSILLYLVAHDYFLNKWQIAGKIPNNQHRGQEKDMTSYNTGKLETAILGVFL